MINKEQLDTKHFKTHNKEGTYSYLCNSHNKKTARMTDTPSKVTCKNCKKILRLL